MPGSPENNQPIEPESQDRLEKLDLFGKSMEDSRRKIEERERIKKEFEEKSVPVDLKELQSHFSSDRSPKVEKAVYRNAIEADLPSWSKELRETPHSEWAVWLSEGKDFPEEREKVLQYLSEHLRDKIVIDLGGGSVNSDRMAQIVNMCGARAYINVDKGTWGENRFIKSEFGITQQLGVHEDILDFVSKIPNDYPVCFIINGIDNIIAPEKDFHKELAYEMARSVAVGGLIITNNWGPGYWSAAPLHYDDTRERERRGELNENQFGEDADRDRINRSITKVEYDDVGQKGPFIYIKTYSPEEFPFRVIYGEDKKPEEYKTKF
jgi:hypothetical protein